MQMLILVLNNVELLEPLLETMTARGLKGATIFNGFAGREGFIGKGNHPRHFRGFVETQYRGHVHITGD